MVQCQCEGNGSLLGLVLVSVPGLFGRFSVSVRVMGPTSMLPLRADASIA